MVRGATPGIPQAGQQQSGDNTRGGDSGDAQAVQPQWRRPQYRQYQRRQQQEIDQVADGTAQQLRILPADAESIPQGASEDQQRGPGENFGHGTSSGAETAGDYS